MDIFAPGTACYCLLQVVFPASAPWSGRCPPFAGRRPARKLLAFAARIDQAVGSEFLPVGLDDGADPLPMVLEIDAGRRHRNVAQDAAGLTIPLAHDPYVTFTGVEVTHHVDRKPPAGV